MADTKISALTAVVTPASTDEFAVNQGGTSKKMTRAQVHALESGEVLLLDDGLTNTPGLAFKADPDTGIFRSGDNAFRLVTNGSTRVTLDNSSFKGAATSYFQIDVGSAASATNPAYAFSGDGDTGVGKAAADALSLITGAIEAQRLTEASSAVIVSNQANVGLTADVGSAQGNGVITSTYNVYSTVGTIGDAATLPSTFTVGTRIYIKNDGANSMDVFPASGDNAGAGVDTAVAVAAGDFAVFIATVADSTWTKLMGGTA